MELVTVIILVVAVFLTLTMPCAVGLVTYVTVLVWYPQFHGFSLGTVDLDVGRIVILVLVCKLCIEGKTLKLFKWNPLDILVVVTLAGQTVAGIMTTDLEPILENRAGAAFNTLLPYFAFRLVLTNYRTLFTFLRRILIISAPLAVLGVIQCATGHNPVNFMRGAFPSSPAERLGLYRADVTFPHYIMYGLFFAIVAPWCACLWRNTSPRVRGRVAVGLLLMLAGGAASLSTGAFLALAISVPLILAYPYRRYWKIFAGLLFVGVVALEIASNSPWHAVLGRYATLNPDTAYYRVELVKEAFGGGMTGHWLAGYGLGAGARDEFTVWEHKDIVNHYVLILLRYGLLGLLPFVACLVAAFAQLRRSYVRASTEGERWTAWCMTAGLLGTAAAMFSVSLFGQPSRFFFMMLGICGGLSTMRARPQDVYRRRNGAGVQTHGAAPGEG